MRADFHVFHLRSSAGLYGAEYVVLGLIPALERAGIGSTLLCLHNTYLAMQSLYMKARALRIPAERVPCGGRFDWSSITALRKLLARQPNAILHVHDYKSAFHGWIARGRRATPLVATSHGQFSSTPRLHLYHRLETSLMRRFDRVCVVSSEMAGPLREAGVEDARIALVENGIDTARFTPHAMPLPRSQVGVGEHALVFGSAMRLDHQKNPLLLVEAFARVAAGISRAELVIAGDGPLRDAVCARAMELGVGDRVHLLGSRGDLERFYRMLDVFVLPSDYEGLPLALLEAMAAGCRIVTTHVGQIAAVLDGLSVAPVPAGDCEALALAMRKAATTPVDERLRERVVTRYSLDRMAAAYGALYHDVWSCRERAAA
jgi:glycosyltransferase involved in cell wall biosynthesis